MSLDVRELMLDAVMLARCPRCHRWPTWRCDLPGTGVHWARIEAVMGPPVPVPRSA
jgi:hypothetical protein